jgi:hypothetical protein
VVEPLTRGTTNLTISDGLTTPLHRPDLASPTPDEANPNPNGLGSSSPLWMSPLGNWVIRQVIRLPSSTRTRPSADHPGAITDACPSHSMVWRVRFTRRWGRGGWGSRQAARQSGKGGVGGGDQGGCLDPTATGAYGGSRATREDKAARRRN